MIFLLSPFPDSPGMKFTFTPRRGGTMRRFCSVIFLRIALLFGVILTPASLFAQSIWTERLPGRSFTVEFLHPNFSGSSNSSGNFVLFFTGRIPAWERTDLIIDLPVAHSSWEETMFTRGESNTIVGNPYLGVEIKGPDSPSFAEIGFRLPIIPNDSFRTRNTGYLADFDRQEAFYSDLFMVAVMGNFLVDPPLDHSILRIRFGPNFWLGYGDLQMVIDYSLQGGFASERITFITGISGRFFAIRNNADFSEQIFHQFGVAGSMNFGRFQPGLFFRIPIDEDLSESIDYVLGLNVGIAFD
jgi:hypothetical protein